MESNPKPSEPEAVSPRARRLADPLVFAEPEEESASSDYWSSPLGMAALADWDEDDE